MIKIEKNRLEYLDALRGMAAFAVCIQHIMVYIIHSGGLTHPLYALINITIFDNLDLGRFGVVLFFLISGFIIPNSLKPKTTLSRFLITRIFRLYPAYWLTCILILITAPYLSENIYGMVQFLANLTMVPKFFHAEEMNGIFWTLFVEILFYICCAVLFKMRLLEKPMVIGIIATLLNITPPLFVILNNFFNLHLPIKFILFHLSFLFMGSVFRLALDKKSLSAIKMSYGLLFLMLITVPIITGMLFSVPEATATTFVMFQPKSVVCAYFLALIVFIGVVYFKVKMGVIWVKLGEVSYSLYLLHMLCFLVVAIVVPPVSYVSSIIFILLSIALSYIVAKLSFNMVENPAITLGKKLIHLRNLA